ncbi:MAG: IPT/TIG domain-containing protein [Acidobacteriia bacterium]|nr:IPT/TIG domain-containing protein [Terriglobia bacterium]
MERNRKILLAKAGVLLGLVPVVVWAYEFGPDPGYVAVPSEHSGATCATSGCHTGTTNDPSHQGSVSVNFPNGQTYSPGVTQHLTVTIADPAGTQIAWGFELSARLSSDPTTMAGTFASSDALTTLMCSQPNLFVFQHVSSTPQTCPDGYTVQYIEHSLTGYTTTKGTHGSATYSFNWTPPATNVGNITLYVAGNAANGDLTPNGDHIYATTYTLTPAASIGRAVITSVSNAVSDSIAGVVPGSFIAIKGSNLTSTQFDDWSKSITPDGKLPTELDDVTSVTIGGAPAYIFAISPNQINVQAPDIPAGPAQVVVTTAAGTSDPFSTQVNLAGPALVPWPNNQPGATHGDFSFAAAPGTFAGVNTVAPKPGETISIWGTGFGPSSPAVAAGQEPGPKSGSPLANAVTVMLNGNALQASGFISQFAADYQINVTLPKPLADGNYPLVVIVNGVQSPTYTLTIKN